MGGAGSRVYYGNTRTKPLAVMGITENFAAVSFVQLQHGRFIVPSEVQNRRQVVVLGQTPYESLFPNIDPVGKKVRVGGQEFTVVGVLGKRPAMGGFDAGRRRLRGDPLHDARKVRHRQGRRRPTRSAMIAVVPREDVPRDVAMREVEELMRIRHNLRLDEPNDFDLVTQDAMMKVWEQISQATFLALVVISSIALMVGGIGVMAIMMITVTERTREIGVRKALGARRQEILWQFLIEAVFLTSVGGLLGILLGAGIGMLIHWVSDFPVSLPWWSFAIGIGFSACVGIFFGMVPAIKASRLDPIEALRYE